MKKIFLQTLSLGLLGFVALPQLVTAQSLGAGLSHNHTTVGLNLFYSIPSINDHWTFDLGLKVSPNTFERNENLTNSVYYQTAFAENVFQHISLNGTAHKVLWRWKNLQLNAMANLNFSWHSIKHRAHLFDANMEVLDTDVYYYPAAPVAELTLGPSVFYAINDRYTAYAQAGLGIIYMHHSYKGRNLTKDTDFYAIFLNDWSRGKDRGNFEAVGLDNLPYISAGLRYKLK